MQWLMKIAGRIAGAVWRWIVDGLEILSIADANELVCEGCISCAEEACTGCDHSFCLRCASQRLHLGKCAKCDSTTLVMCNGCEKLCHPANLRTCEQVCVHRFCPHCEKNIVDGKCVLCKATREPVLH